jgi:flagellar motor switch protein FliN
MSGKDDELDPQALADQVAAGMQDDQALADEWAAAMAESGDDEREDEVEKVKLEELKDEGKPRYDNGDGPELDVILDIPVRISMEVGCTQIPIRNLLQLNQGSVVELDRLAGEPLDVLVNGTLIAHGEVVMVNDKFGIRLTDVVSQSERIQRLR